MNYSAKKLLTCSAWQLCRNINNQEDNNTLVTDWMIQGERFQNSVINELGIDSHLSEMGGSYKANNGDMVRFSHDIVAKDGSVIYETKRLPNHELPDEKYLNKSILQCAMYDAMTKASSLKLMTSMFARKNADEYDVITLKEDYKYYLKMGRFTFLVIVTDIAPIIDFIERKIIASKDYDTACDFDEIWHGNEYEMLKHCFSVTEIF